MEEIQEYECAFRAQINSPDEPNGWVYPSTENQFDQKVSDIIVEWMVQGHAFFKRYKYPETFMELIVNCNPETTPSTDLLVHARIAMHLEQRLRAVMISADSV